MITLENVSKKYKIYHEQQSSYGTLVELISNRFKNLFKKKKDLKIGVYENYWALKNIDLSIAEGDRIGIIGRNGAGKSTLLKILARIVQPTTGCIKIRKRISCLIEVGTGFHPELTGRENIFLNGAILGMSRKEIKLKFDDIVAFSEVEKFLDTPVKRFSSGMYMRLGFAIAAHLDPEILIVDEVLAVGDAQFQKKCLTKLSDLSSEGRTVIFVSHDVSSVLTLCNKGIYLEKGQVVEYGSSESCVNTYMKNCRLHDMTWIGNLGDEHISFKSVKLNYGSENREFIYKGEVVNVEVEYEMHRPHSDMILDISIWNQRNQLLASSHTFEKPEYAHIFSEMGTHRITMKIDSDQFREGDYLLKLDCLVPDQKRILHDEITLKFPICAKEKNTRTNSIYKEGVSLGNIWIRN